MRRMFPQLLMLLIVSALILAAGSGCSKKANADDGKASKDGSGDASAIAGEEQNNFKAVNDGILESVRKLYSEKGIDIKLVELEPGTQDGARITLEYTGHSPQQAVLAGLKILRDNFPRTLRFIVVVEGRKYECGSTELAYIISKGYTFEATEEEAQLYMDVVNNGIPPEEAEQPIGLEKI